jgi:hypothetical protein
MRINLKTPFAEKDAVKALGARWDAAKKLWYITDVADLTPFLRWIPDPQAATENPSANAQKPDSTTAKPGAGQSPGGVVTKPLQAPAYCGCPVLPWEHCEHSSPA